LVLDALLFVRRLAFELAQAPHRTEADPRSTTGRAHAYFAELETQKEPNQRTIGTEMISVPRSILRLTGCAPAVRRSTAHHLETRHGIATAEEWVWMRNGCCTGCGSGNRLLQRTGKRIRRHCRGLDAQNQRQRQRALYPRGLRGRDGAWRRRRSRMPRGRRRGPHVVDQ